MAVNNHRVLLWLAAVGVLLSAIVGCRKETTVDEELNTAQESGEWRAHDFAFAIENLQRLERFSGNEMRQQMIDRLNQWVQHETVPADWSVDPMVAQLPKPLTELPEVASLDKMLFSPYDGYALQEAVWMRDLSNWARGDAVEDLARAENLFDWVVRNLQLMEDDPDRLAQRPWETLLWGRGTAVDRAWVFVLLLRQQGIDAVVLGLPNPKDPTGKKLDPWAVGVLVGKELYLFDPRLGLPIPGPAGAKYEDGRLVVHPATLAQAAADPSLLRKLDVPEHPYPVDAERLAGVVALIEGSPAYLAARMQVVESRLVGDQQILLTSSPSKQAERLNDVAHLAGRQLWAWPYEVADRRRHMTDQQREAYDTAMAPFQARRDTPLWKGRVLHLKGRFAEEHGAMYYYLEARPSTRAVALGKRQIAETTNPEEASRMRMILDARLRGKSDATYWIGLVEVAEGRPEVAANYFQMWSLVKPWNQGARYNLGRVAETLGRLKEAAAIYRTSPASPNTPGNLLRAKWLDSAEGEIKLPGGEEEPKS